MITQEYRDLLAELKHCRSLEDCLELEDQCEKEYNLANISANQLGRLDSLITDKMIKLGAFK
jgi:hypothetical protein